jgi:uncharacterized protein
MSWLVSELTINISRLSEGAHHYNFEAEPKSIGLDARFNKPVLVRAQLEKTGRQMLLRSEVQTLALFTCDRCLDEFEQDMSSHFEIVYITEEDGVHANDEKEVQFLTPDTNILDVGEDTRQFLILSVPQKLLCRDDCKGLCPRCGSNRNKVHCDCVTENTDPRWDGLKKVSLN